VFWDHWVPTATAPLGRCWSGFKRPYRFFRLRPSAWAVAKRDAPKVAEQLWTFQPPKGPNGRYDTGIDRFWGIWNFSTNKPAAKSLLAYLSTRSSVEKLIMPTL
jgi:hypothetical protein